MPASLPAAVDYLVIGAGVHGLSTARSLAERGEEVLVIDKSSVGSGASGIACGVVRNNYYQPAMAELMAACVEMWEADAEALSYHSSGYIALGPESQRGDLEEVFERQQRIGYDSELHTGEADVMAHMKTLYPDWRAPGLTVCLHEHVGGFAFNKESMLGLADLGRAAGASIIEGVEVTGFVRDGSGAVTSVQTSSGEIAIGKEVVVAVGPWIAGMWEMLELPDRLDVRQPDGSLAEDLPMWTYWYLQEGELDLPPETLDTAAGKPSPVLHVDSDAPLHADDGTLITDEPWGVYFKPDRKSVQGGAAPIQLGNEFDVDPYPTGTVDDDFGQMWSSSLSHCMERFEGTSSKFIDTRSGGVGAFTVDNFPVFDRMAPNVFIAADSNHGYKMLAVGREIASVLIGEHSTLLAPFSYERFSTGDLHPVSNSPYPWS